MEKSAESSQYCAQHLTGSKGSIHQDFFSLRHLNASSIFLIQSAVRTGAKTKQGVRIKKTNSLSLKPNVNGSYKQHHQTSRVRHLSRIWERGSRTSYRTKATEFNVSLLITDTGDSVQTDRIINICILMKVFL